MSAPRSRSGNFYVWISLAMLAAVLYGFSQTFDHALIHSSRTDLGHLYFHGAVFLLWMILFVVQSALVRLRNIRLHRLLGWATVADGVLVLIAGFWVTFATPAPAALYAVGTTSMLGFGIPFALAIVWRRKPELHRRLLLMATAMLTNAAFARFPASFMLGKTFYIGTDFFILAGVANDLWRYKTIHPVYRYGLPLFLLAQVSVMAAAWRYL